MLDYLENATDRIERLLAAKLRKISRYQSVYAGFELFKI
jgi:hypothetical protein